MGVRSRKFWHYGPMVLLAIAMGYATIEWITSKKTRPARASQEAVEETDKPDNLFHIDYDGQIVEEEGFTIDFKDRYDDMTYRLVVINGSREAYITLRDDIKARIITKLKQEGISPRGLQNIVVPSIAAEHTPVYQNDQIVRRGVVRDKNSQRQVVDCRDLANEETINIIINQAYNEIKAEAENNQPDPHGGRRWYVGEDGKVHYP